MQATLKTCTALTVILALTSAAGAGMNNMPIPQIVRPVITPPVDVRHLAPKPERRDRKSVKQRQRNRQQRSTRPSGGKRRMSETAARERLLLPKHPPLPQSKPDFAALNDTSREAGPQPEPPTREGIDELERLRGRIRDLALLEEHGNARDLKETLEGNRALDESGIGGGSGGERHGPSGFDWREMVPEGNTKDQGPQNDKLWKPSLPGPSAYGRGLDREQGLTSPWKSQSGERDTPGFGRTPGRAGAGLKGQRGWNSQDGSNDDASGDAASGDDTSSDIKEWTAKHPDGSTVTTRETSDEHGVYRRVDTERADGSWSHTSIIITPSGATRVRYKDSEFRTWTVDYNRRGEIIDSRPDSQPAPDQPASGQSMPCPKTSRGCGPSGGIMSYKPSKGDKVSQPGKGDDQGTELGFKASVAERKSVVTNPVDPENHVRTGGGGRPRPIEHVTQPGGAGPDQPGT